MFVGAVYELKLGCSLPASALSSCFGLFLKALPMIAYLSAHTIWPVTPLYTLLM